MQTSASASKTDKRAKADKEIMIADFQNDLLMKSVNENLTEIFTLYFNALTDATDSLHSHGEKSLEGSLSSSVQLTCPWSS